MVAIVTKTENDGKSKMLWLLPGQKGENNGDTCSREGNFSHSAEMYFQFLLYLWGWEIKGNLSKGTAGVFNTSPNCPSDIKTRL